MKCKECKKELTDRRLGRHIRNDGTLYCMDCYVKLLRKQREK